MDKSLFVPHKNPVGRTRKEQWWIFGVYEPERRKGFLIPVQNRSTEFHILIIEKWVAPRSIIWSDMWMAYRSLEDLGFDHGGH